MNRVRSIRPISRKRARHHVRLRQGGELLEDGRGGEDAVLDRDADAQRLVPALADCGGIDALADVMLEGRVGLCGLKGVQAPVLEVA
jgi:hypothetical protein